MLNKEKCFPLATHGNLDIQLPRVSCITETPLYRADTLLDFACRHEHNLVVSTAAGWKFFFLPKWKHLIILWVSPPSASCVKILLLYTSLPPRGSSSRAISVTFDYGLEGKEQQHNSLISNRWLRSSKGLFCLGACSSDWPGMQTDQRRPEHGGSAAPAPVSHWLCSCIASDRCHILASWVVHSAYWSGRVIVIWSKMPFVSDKSVKVLRWRCNFYLFFFTFCISPHHGNGI